MSQQQQQYPSSTDSNWSDRDSITWEIISNLSNQNKHNSPPNQPKTINKSVDDQSLPHHGTSFEPKQQLDDIEMNVGITDISFDQLFFNPDKLFPTSPIRNNNNNSDTICFNNNNNNHTNTNIDDSNDALDYILQRFNQGPPLIPPQNSPIPGNNVLVFTPSQPHDEIIDPMNSHINGRFVIDDDVVDDSDDDNVLPSTEILQLFSSEFDHLGKLGKLVDSFLDELTSSSHIPDHHETNHHSSSTTNSTLQTHGTTTATTTSNININSKFDNTKSIDLSDTDDHIVHSFIPLVNSNFPSSIQHESKLKETIQDDDYINNYPHGNIHPQITETDDTYFNINKIPSTTSLTYVEELLPEDCSECYKYQRHISTQDVNIEDELQPIFNAIFDEMPFPPPSYNDPSHNSQPPSLLPTTLSFTSSTSSSSSSISFTSSTSPLSFSSLDSDDFDPIDDSDDSDDSDDEYLFTSKSHLPEQQSQESINNNNNNNNNINNITVLLSPTNMTLPPRYPNFPISPLNHLYMPVQESKQIQQPPTIISSDITKSPTLPITSDTTTNNNDINHASNHEECCNKTNILHYLVFDCDSDYSDEWDDFFHTNNHVINTTKEAPSTIEFPQFDEQSTTSSLDIEPKNDISKLAPADTGSPKVTSSTLPSLQPNIPGVTLNPIITHFHNPLHVVNNTIDTKSSELPSSLSPQQPTSTLSSSNTTITQTVTTIPSSLPIVNDIIPNLDYDEFQFNRDFPSITLSQDKLDTQHKQFTTILYDIENHLIEREKSLTQRLEQFNNMKSTYKDFLCRELLSLRNELQLFNLNKLQWQHEQDEQKHEFDIIREQLIQQEDQLSILFATTTQIKIEYESKLSKLRSIISNDDNNTVHNHNHNSSSSTTTPLDSNTMLIDNQFVQSKDDIVISAKQLWEMIQNHQQSSHNKTVSLETIESQSLSTTSQAPLITPQTTSITSSSASLSSTPLVNQSTVFEHIFKKFSLWWLPLFIILSFTLPTLFQAIILAIVIKVSLSFLRHTFSRLLSRNSMVWIISIITLLITIRLYSQSMITTPHNVGDSININNEQQLIIPSSNDTNNHQIYPNNSEAQSTAISSTSSPPPPLTSEIETPTTPSTRSLGFFSYFLLMICSLICVSFIRFCSQSINPCFP